VQDFDEAAVAINAGNQQDAKKFEDDARPPEITIDVARPAVKFKRLLAGKGSRERPGGQNAAVTPFMKGTTVPIPTTCLRVSRGKRSFAGS
jgi:hypothetical protein